jgi:GABA(A) receptor-associated protein
LFLLVNGKHLMKNDTKLQIVYDDHRNEDGFLYITYATENTLGAFEQ